MTPESPEELGGGSEPVSPSAADADWSQPTLSQPVFTSVPLSGALAGGRPRLVYPQGKLAPWQPQVIELIADIAVAAMPIPLRVLDVGCGDGRLLTELITRVPYADAYVGVEPAADVLAATHRSADPTVSLVRAAAEALPFRHGCFDLVVVVASFGYWFDQRAGAAELARVVSPTGKVVLVEPAKPEVVGRRRARTDNEIASLLESAGLQVEQIEKIRRSTLSRAVARAFISSL
jgi:ubiquinone/menaquinone biosynthesis C-methylase UbiE